MQTAVLHTDLVGYQQTTHDQIVTGIAGYAYLHQHQRDEMAKTSLSQLIQDGAPDTIATEVTRESVEPTRLLQSARAAGEEQGRLQAQVDLVNALSQLSQSVEKSHRDLKLRDRFTSRPARVAAYLFPKVGALAVVVGAAFGLRSLAVTGTALGDLGTAITLAVTGVSGLVTDLAVRKLGSSRVIIREANEPLQALERVTSGKSFEESIATEVTYQSRIQLPVQAGYVEAAQTAYMKEVSANKRLLNGVSNGERSLVAAGHRIERLNQSAYVNLVRNVMSKLATKWNLSQERTNQVSKGAANDAYDALLATQASYEFDLQQNQIVQARRDAISIRARTAVEAARASGHDAELERFATWIVKRSGDGFRYAREVALDEAMSLRDKLGMEATASPFAFGDRPFEDLAVTGTYEQTFSTIAAQTRNASPRELGD